MKRNPLPLVIEPMSEEQLIEMKVWLDDLKVNGLVFDSDKSIVPIQVFK